MPGSEVNGAPLQVLLLEEGAFPAAAGAICFHSLWAIWWVGNCPTPVQAPDYVVFVLILGEEGSYGCR
jgi:hypothetical protein